MRSPHLLLASSNVSKLRANLAPLLDAQAQAALQREHERQVRLLFRLGEEHLELAALLPPAHWRHAVSRAYYAAYNASRSLRLAESGAYSTDATDHKQIDKLPLGLANEPTYVNQLPRFRDDRNLCDYDHEVTQAELVNTPSDWVRFADDFLRDVRAYLSTKGFTV